MKINKETCRSLFLRMVAMSFIATTIFAIVQGQDSRQRSERFKPQPAGQSNEEVTAPGIVISPRDDHRIGPGDVIEIQVNLAPEVSNTVRVNADGTILMPVIGRVHAERKTGEELSEEVAAKLKGSYLKEPIVKVAIRQIYSHTYLIQGAVRRSGVYQIEGRPTLLELLTVSGGLIENHGTTAFVIRRIKAKTPDPAQPIPASVEQAATTTATAAITAATTTATAVTPAVTPATTTEENAAAEGSTLPTSPAVTFEMLKINISGLLKGNFDQNMSLEPGDIVNIPQSDVFFVAGEVREPGSFPLKEGTTLRQAISLAQGTTPKAAGSRAVVYRYDGNGQRHEIKVDLDQVMRGKGDDMALTANDIVIVPNSALKSTALPVLNAFGSGLAFAVGGRLPAR